jgi:hypothetical protein
LDEGGASLLMLMAKSRHRKAENVRRSFHPSLEAIGAVTVLLVPGDRGERRRVPGALLQHRLDVYSAGACWISRTGARLAQPPSSGAREVSQVVTAT